MSRCSCEASRVVQLSRRSAPPQTPQSAPPQTPQSAPPQTPQSAHPPSEEVTAASLLQLAPQGAAQQVAASVPDAPDEGVCTPEGQADQAAGPADGPQRGPLSLGPQVWRAATRQKVGCDPPAGLPPPGAALRHLGKLGGLWCGPALGLALTAAAAPCASGSCWVTLYHGGRSWGPTCRAGACQCGRGCCLAGRWHVWHCRAVPDDAATAGDPCCRGAEQDAQSGKRQHDGCRQALRPFSCILHSSSMSAPQQSQPSTFRGCSAVRHAVL